MGRIEFLKARLTEEEAEAHALGDTLAGNVRVLNVEWRRLKLGLAVVVPVFGQAFIRKWLQSYAGHPDFDSDWQF